MSVILTIGGTPVRCNEVTISNSLEQPGAILDALLVEPTAALDLPSGRQQVQCDLGYSLVNYTSFFGWTEADDLRSTGDTPYTNRLTAWGPLALANRPAFKGASYRSINGSEWTDGALVASLLEQSGVPSIQRSVADSERVLLTQQALQIQSGQSWLSSIRRLDRVTNYITRDMPNGIVTRTPWPLDGETAPAFDWLIVEAVPGSGQYPLFELGRRRALSDVRNMVKVLGYVYPQPLGESLGYYNRPHAVRIAASGLVADPPGYVPETIDDTLIETNDHAGTLALQWMKRLNLLPDPAALLMSGNPEIVPGHVVGLLSSTLELSSFTAFVVTSTQHSWTEDSALTRLGLTRSNGAVGTVQDIRPVLDFTLDAFGTVLTAEVFGGVTKFDSEGDFLYRWSNYVNARTLEGIGETSYAVDVALGEDETPSIPGGMLVRLEAEDSRDRIRNWRARGL